MNLAFRFVVVLALAGSSLGCSRPSTVLSDAHSTAIRDSVTLALAAFQRYSAAAQWDSLAGLYSEAPGFRFAESGALRYRSAAAIRDALSTVPAGTRIETTYRETEIDPLAPGLAVVSTLFETSFVDSTNARFSFGGAITMVWAHEEQGWRIRHGHSSAPVARGP